MEIIQRNYEKDGFFKVYLDNIEIGKLTYKWNSNNELIIDHTRVDYKYAGKGVGFKLVMQAVKFARDNNIKIVPLCPFVISIFKKTPQISDVLSD